MKANNLIAKAILSYVKYFIPDSKYLLFIRLQIPNVYLLTKEKLVVNLKNKFFRILFTSLEKDDNERFIKINNNKKFLYEFNRKENIIKKRTNRIFQENNKLLGNVLFKLWKRDIKKKNHLN